jgi:hypothetical protein
MPKAKDTPPAVMRAVANFCVGVRTINAGEEFPADDELVAGLPDMFEPVMVGEAGPEPFIPLAGTVVLSAEDMRA